MPRFAWAAWGLLVVVLDLPLLGWDVLPDLVGYVWLFIGLAGGAALHPGFARARAAALVGIPVSVITGTPFTNSSTGVEWGAAFAGILVNVVVLHQLGTAIRDLDPVEGDSDQRRWANGIRIAAPIAGGVQLVGLVLIAHRARHPLRPRPARPGRRGDHRRRAAAPGQPGRLARHPGPGDARRAADTLTDRSRVENTPPPRTGDGVFSTLDRSGPRRQRRKGTSRSSRPRSLSSARSGISSSIQPLCLMPQNDAWSGP